MNSKLLPLTALALTLVSSAAKADWQYTKWGMNPDEVVKASEGKVLQCTSEICDGHQPTGVSSDIALLFAKYSAGKYPFHAFFYFDKKSRGLTIVNLNLVDRSLVLPLGADLKARYGEPSEQSRTSVTRDMQWRTETDDIFFSVIGSDNASIRYRARKNPNNQGL